jgi:hypothetical protein
MLAERLVYVANDDAVISSLDPLTIPFRRCISINAQEFPHITDDLSAGSFSWLPALKKLS